MSVLFASWRRRMCKQYLALATLYIFTPCNISAFGEKTQFSVWTPSHADYSWGSQSTFFFFLKDGGVDQSGGESFARPSNLKKNLQRWDQLAFYKHDLFPGLLNSVVRQKVLAITGVDVAKYHNRRMGSSKLFQEMYTSLSVHVEVKIWWSMCYEHVRLGWDFVRPVVSYWMKLESPVSKFRRPWRSVDLQLTTILKIEDRRRVFEVDDVVPGQVCSSLSCCFLDTPWGSIDK
jgi:hypothetical protein